MSPLSVTIYVTDFLPEQWRCFVRVYPHVGEHGRRLVCGNGQGLLFVRREVMSHCFCARSSERAPLNSVPYRFRLLDSEPTVEKTRNNIKGGMLVSALVVIIYIITYFLFAGRCMAYLEKRGSNIRGLLLSRFAVRSGSCG